MPLSYTADQLTRETQLLICEIAVLTDSAINEGAALRALEVTPESEFGQSRHPDDLADLDKYEIWQHIVRIERYVQQQQWHDSLPTDVRALQMVVERVFSPTVLREYAQERLLYPEPDGIPGPLENGAGDVGLGHFHNNILARLAALASARLKLDQGERLSMAEVAQLIDVREATVVTNAHRKNFASIEEDNRRYVEPTDILPWMLKNGYRPTTKGGSATEPRPAAHDRAADEMVFVPVAKDGTWFNPEARHAGRYIIGAGRSELKFTDYFEALASLVTMPTPRWRTKTDGVPGIAFGIRFDRVRHTDLERALANK